MRRYETSFVFSSLYPIIHCNEVRLYMHHTQSLGRVVKRQVGTMGGLKRIQEN